MILWSFIFTFRRISLVHRRNKDGKTGVRVFMSGRVIKEKNDDTAEMITHKKWHHEK